MGTGAGTLKKKVNRLHERQTIQSTTNAFPFFPQGSASNPSCGSYDTYGERSTRPRAQSSGRLPRLVNVEPLIENSNTYVPLIQPKSVEQCFADGFHIHCFILW